MRVKIATPFEAQDQSAPGGSRRFDAGTVHDLPEPWALSLIYSGAAVAAVESAAEPKEDAETETKAKGKVAKVPGKGA